MNMENANSQNDGMIEVAAAPASTRDVYSEAKMMTSTITCLFSQKE